MFLAPIAPSVIFWTDGILSLVTNRSSFLIGELLLGKLSEAVVVQGDAPHDRPGFLVSHLIGNRASFLCTKAPMPRIPETNFLKASHQLVGEMFIHARMRSALAGLDEGEFTEGHELDRKWKVAKEMVGRRLSQEEAKRLLAEFE